MEEHLAAGLCENCVEDGLQALGIVAVEEEGLEKVVDCVFQDEHTELGVRISKSTSLNSMTSTSFRRISRKNLSNYWRLAVICLCPRLDSTKRSLITELKAERSCV